MTRTQLGNHPKARWIVRAQKGSGKRRRSVSLRCQVQTATKYPPAVFKEGGKGSSVRHIPSSDNRGAGGSMGRQLKKFKDGAKVVIKTVWNVLF